MPSQYSLDGKPPREARSGKQCCLVCRRMFPDEAALDLHCEKSQLHVDSYQKALEAGRIQVLEPKAQSAMELLASFEQKLSGNGSTGEPKTTYRDRAKERRDVHGTGGDDDDMALAVGSVRRAREINQNIDWRCGYCEEVNMARVVICAKCQHEVDDRAEHLQEHAQQKRHKKMLQLAEAMEPSMLPAGHVDSGGSANAERATFRC
eukprot:TRINITY_DN38474_c0_g1_i1.p1 TRINITY_DN38474_c0_g1~~TRINITY_DN38474_c0_g1_i1.p1  ORF type:complete len:206 (+),score=48.43 TRINITY_DN38474_c0_g1_i1:223-840(+)